MAGKIIAGRHVRAACARHLADLSRSDITWRAARAEAVLVFVGSCFIEPGKLFTLADFQAFILGSLFGWYRGDRRRFRVAYGEMGKGNGKTPLAAVIGLYGLIMDNEPAPEIYAAAVAKEQAKICFTDADRIVQATPELRSRITRLTNNLSAPARMGKFTVLSSEDKGKHGLRIHMGLLDEIHAHSSAAMVDVIEAGTKNCRNSLILLITNSGSDRRGPCWAYHQRALDMLGGKPDDELFAYVCTLDPCPQCEARGKKQPDPKCPACDDWRDFDILIKANPGIGTILDPDYLQRRVALAQRMPSKMNNVMQLNCCLWTESDDGWADMYAWRNHCLAPALRLEQFAGKPCWIGMDAANRVDCTCVALIFEREPGRGTLDPAGLNTAAQQAIKEALGQPDDSPRAASGDQPGEPVPAELTIAAAGYALFLRTYVPRDLVYNSSQANHEAYLTWAHAGHLIVTPGAITDFARIEADLQEIAEAHVVTRLQADPRELGYLLQRVQAWAGFEVVQVSQGPVMISQPMKMMEGLIAAGLIAHDGNPVMDWMLGNVVQKTTRSGGPVKYYYPTRPAEEKKIDGVAAALLALDGALRGAPPELMPGLAMLG